MSEDQKLYAYVDESGQDTKGALFVVSVVVLEEEREDITKELERIEKESGKKNVKWHKARPEFREAYLRNITQSPLFINTLFFETFSESKEYLEMTSYATAKAILKKAADRAYRVTVYVDGFNAAEVSHLRQELKALNIKQRKVKGVRRDENNALIRLADALCGLVRDARDGNLSASDILRMLGKKKIVTAL